MGGMVDVRRCPGCDAELEIGSRLIPGFPTMAKVVCPLCSSFVATVRNDVGEPHIRVAGAAAAPPTPPRSRGFRRLFT